MNLCLRELDESEVEREVILEEGNLELPCDIWIWRFAPAPEGGMRYHLKLEVGTYVLGSHPCRLDDDI